MAQTVAKSHNSNTLSWQNRIQEKQGEKNITVAKCDVPDSKNLWEEN